MKESFMSSFIRQIPLPLQVFFTFISFSPVALRVDSAPCAAILSNQIKSFSQTSRRYNFIHFSAARTKLLAAVSFYTNKRIKLSIERENKNKIFPLQKHKKLMNKLNKYKKYIYFYTISSNILNII